MSPEIMATTDSVDKDDPPYPLSLSSLSCGLYHFRPEDAQLFVYDLQKVPFDTANTKTMANTLVPTMFTIGVGADKGTGNRGRFQFAWRRFDHLYFRYIK